jgi:hypothetical protein
VVDQGYGGILKVIAFSLPNFFEAIAGSILVFLILFFINDALAQRKSKLAQSRTTLYLLTFVLAGIYVILQEFKIHNLGGENIYDPYDVLFSVIGLFVGLGILFKTGKAREEDFKQ